MPFDVRTLVGATALVWLLASACLVFVWFSRKTYPGFGYWTAHAFAVTAGLVLIGLRGTVPLLVSVGVGNGLLLAGSVMSLRAVRLFYGRSMNPAWWVALAAAVVLTAAFGLAWPERAIRVLVGSTFTMCVGAVVAWDLVARAGPDVRGSSRFTGAVVLGMALVAAHRFVAAATSGTMPQVFTDTWFQAVHFLTFMAVGLLGAFGFILMNAQRLEHDLAATRDRLRVSVADLERKATEIRVLSGLLPICASCKKIRDEAGEWDSLEAYISERSEAEFSHSVCPDCAGRLYPEFAPHQESRE